MTNEPAVLPNFDPIAIGDEIAALETEAQSELAEAKGEFASRSEKIAAIIWEVQQHHPEHLDAICQRAKIGVTRRKELLQIGSGRKTIKQSRQETAARQKKFKAKKLAKRLPKAARDRAAAEILAGKLGYVIEDKEFGYCVTLKDGTDGVMIAHLPGLLSWLALRQAEAVTTPEGNGQAEAEASAKARKEAGNNTDPDKSKAEMSAAHAANESEGAPTAKPKPTPSKSAEALAEFKIACDNWLPKLNERDKAKALDYAQKAAFTRTLMVELHPSERANGGTG
jgi:hypothetical protein